MLITAGIIGEDAYVAALAAWLRVPFEPLAGERDDCPLPDTQFIDAAKSGLLPLHLDGAIVWVVAPYAWTARRLVTGAHPLPKDRFRLTSPRRLRQFVAHHGAQALGARAANALRTAHPALSAAVCPPRARAGWLAGLSIAASVALFFHGTASVLASAVLALTFLAWTALRLAGAATAWRGTPAVRLAPHDLPIYTLIVALYDEADAVPGLVRALRQIDYPAEKLQIMIALEPDDFATQNAFAVLALGPPFEIVVAPEVGPAHQAEGTQCRTGARTRQLYGGVRRRGSPCPGPTSSRARRFHDAGRRHRMRAGPPHDRQHARTPG